MALYGILAVYFSCVMIRLLLVLAPSVCVLAGIGVSEVASKMIESIKEQFSEGQEEENKEEEDQSPTKEINQSTTSKKGKGKKQQ